MARKTIVIELVVDDDGNQREKREQVTSAVEDSTSDLHRGLLSLGWSGNRTAVAVTVSNPARTAHWPV